MSLQVWGCVFDTVGTACLHLFKKVPLHNLTPIQLRLPLLPIRTDLPQQLIIPPSVIVFLQVAQFVEYHIVNALFGCLYQFQVEGDIAHWRAATPTTFQRADSERRIGHAQPFDPWIAGVEPFLEDPHSLSLVPIVQKLLHSRCVVFVGGPDVEIAPTEFDPLLFSLDDFEPVLSAQIAMGFSADVLAGRRGGWIAGKLALMA